MREESWCEDQKQNKMRILKKGKKETGQRLKTTCHSPGPAKMGWGQVRQVFKTFLIRSVRFSNTVKV